MLTSLIRLMLFGIFIVGVDGSWWDMIPGGLRLVFSLVLFFVNLLVLVVVLYLAGLIVVGKKRALLTDAFIVSFLGTVLSTLFLMFVPYRFVALVLSIVVWLLLIKRFYETGWLGATAVGILAIIIFLAVTVLVALFFDIFYTISEFFFSFTIMT